MTQSLAFKLGDKVRVTEAGSRFYTITKAGSEGTIVEINLKARIYRIAFTNIPGWGGQTVFPFSLEELKNNFELLESFTKSSLSKADEKYKDVILKIRSMQSKRKAKGYAY